MTATSTSERLRAVLESATPRLLALSDAAAALPLKPGAWSRKELLGHLIDSASNNHQRFVRANFQEDLVFPGYEQDEWVRVQRYATRPWRDLVTLWREFNLHLAHVIETTPRTVRERAHHRHSLHLIAWQTVPEELPTTLDYFHADYVGHLEHHLHEALGS